MSACLAIVPVLDRDKLAARVVERMDGIAVKLRELEDDIRLLWDEFDKLAEGETIHQMHDAGAVLLKHLHRTPRAIQYMLNGRTPTKVLPPSTDTEANIVRVDSVPVEDVPAYHETAEETNARMNAWRLNALLGAHCESAEAVTKVYDWLGDACGHGGEGTLRHTFGKLLNLIKETRPELDKSQREHYREVILGLHLISRIAETYAQAFTDAAPFDLTDLSDLRTGDTANRLQSTEAYAQETMQKAAR